MPAKPVIDIMAPVHSLDASRPAIEAAASAGYLYASYKPDVMHWFCKPSLKHRTHHLHLVPKASLLWRQRLMFRDTLRADPALAQEYADLKLRLAEKDRFDREAKDFTNQRIRKRGEVDEVERSRNRNKSRIRARVEHVFAVVKRLWGFTKVRYRGLDKNATRSFAALGLANLYLARGRLTA